MAWDVDPNNLLSTPVGYATPAQLESVRSYAQALQKESTQPVKHWTMGLSNMLAALVGGMESNQANRMERGQREAAARILGGDTGGTMAPGAAQGLAPVGGVPTPPPGALAQPAAGPGAPVPSQTGGATPDYRTRVAQLESGGDPNARTGSYSGTYQLSARSARATPMTRLPSRRSPTATARL